MELDKQVFTANCPLCNKEKIYKSSKTYIKCKNKPCKSCSNSIQKGGSGNVRPIGKEKTCACCKNVKPLNEFFFYEEKKRYHSLCFDCKKEKFKSYQKNIGRFKKYNLSKEDYEKQYAIQEGKCYVCETHYADLCIDHCHKTNKVRKLLCFSCNAALGLLKENLNTITNLKNYVEEHTDFRTG